MGKLTDALERQRDEKDIKAKMLHGQMPEEKPIPKWAIKDGLNPKLVTVSAPDSVDAENFRALRALILFPQGGKRPSTIMVASALPGEGKTFVSANLAVCVAQGVSEKALLVDCDFRHPSTHKMIGYDNREGLAEYLTGEKQLDELLIQTRIKKLSLLTAGKASPNPAELLTSQKMQSFLEHAGNSAYENITIIDTPPLDVTSESAVLSHYVDGVILVVRAEHTPRETIRRSIETFGKQKIIGVFFNGYERTSKKYYKYYRKYYKK